MRPADATIRCNSWSQDGPYHPLTLERMVLLPGKVLAIERHSYIGRLTQREWFVMRVSFEGGTFGEAISPVKGEIDALVADFERRKARGE